MKILQVLLSLVLFVATLAIDYCNPDLCQVGDPPTTADHIDCSNPGTFAATCPDTARIPDISAHIDLILQMINTRRNTVALGGLSGFQPAVRMGTVAWSNDLSRFARLTARRCSASFDDCRNTYSFQKVAQMYFTQFSFAANINYREHLIQMIQTWYQKHTEADAAKMASYVATTPNYSPFAILVNERVTHVGCGSVTYTRNGRLDVITFCNFASRNTVGSRVYLAGTAASQCITGKNPTYPGLCSETEAIDPNAP